jgi:hypothetical protein
MKPNPFFTSNHFTVPTNIGPPTKNFTGNVEPDRASANGCGRAATSQAVLIVTSWILCLHEMHAWVAGIATASLSDAHPEANDGAPRTSRHFLLTNALHAGANVVLAPRNVI